MIGSMCLHTQGTVRAVWCGAMAVIASACMAASMVAQTRYVYFPSPKTNDGRFLTLAGAGLNTLGEDIVLKIASPANAASIEIGIFDGETGGRWDMGSLPMQYKLVADRNGDGTGTVVLGEWSGSQMPDNDWFTATVANSDSAKSPTGDYFYTLIAHNPDISVASVWSNFKIRTSGTVVALINRPVAYTAPVFSLGDANYIFPSYPTTTPTTYDGTWDFYFWLRQPASRIDVWDGDMDYGSYNCTVNDDNDPDTPDSTLPAWAHGTMAVAEGTATSSVACVDASGTAIGGTTTSNPPDDSRNAVTRREASVSYEMITPDGTHYANNNPSGNLEWECFTLSTAAYDRTKMDYHVDSLPAGIYRVRIAGVDMNNLNAFRFPLDALGVDSVGAPVLPIVPDYTDGVISGMVYYENSGDTTQDPDEPGIPSITVTLLCDYNNDGVIDGTYTTETDADGVYTFAGLSVGTYTVKVDLGTLSDDVSAVNDPDGTATMGVAKTTLTLKTKARTEPFGYKRNAPACSRPPQPCSYWARHTNEWPCSSVRCGNRTYTKSQCLDILRRPTSGDNSYQMCAQLICAKLNIANGCDQIEVEGDIADADDYVANNPPGCRRKSWSFSHQTNHRKLNDYNNGRSCGGNVR